MWRFGLAAAAAVLSAAWPAAVQVTGTAHLTRRRCCRAYAEAGELRDRDQQRGPACLGDAAAMYDERRQAGAQSLIKPRAMAKLLSCIAQVNCLNPV